MQSLLNNVPKTKQKKKSKKKQNFVPAIKKETNFFIIMQMSKNKKTKNKNTFK